MWRVWVLSNAPEGFQLNEVESPATKVAQDVQTNVVELFSSNYKYARVYFNMLLRNFMEFWEIEDSYQVSLYRDLAKCSIHNLKHFLRDISDIDIKDPEYLNFLVGLKNYCYSRINRVKHV